jgi:hypothetical protein
MVRSRRSILAGVFAATRDGHLLNTEAFDSEPLSFVAGRMGRSVRFQSGVCRCGRALQAIDAWSARLVLFGRLVGEVQRAVFVGLASSEAELGLDAVCE